MKHYLLSLLLLLFSGTSYAQLVAWNFGPATRGDEKTSVSTFADPCMEASELSRGPGVRPQRATYSFAGLWPGCNSMLGAVRQGAFYEFSLVLQVLTEILIKTRASFLAEKTCSCIASATRRSESVYPHLQYRWRTFHRHRSAGTRWVHRE